MDAFAGAIGVSESDGKCSPECIVCDPLTPDTIPEYYAPAWGRCHAKASLRCRARLFVNMPHAFASPRSGKCGCLFLLVRSRSKWQSLSKRAAAATTSIFAHYVRRLALCVNT